MKDNRKIVRGVRLDGRLYKAGEEDELAGVLSAAQLKRLSGNGALEGDWGKATAAEDVASKDAAPKPAESKPAAKK